MAIGTSARWRAVARGVWMAVTLTVVAIALISCSSASTPGTATTSAVPRPNRDGRPNVIVIMTDDQRADEMQHLPKTKRLLGAEGTTFTNSFVSFPLCCPSRASALTGLHAHNHGVLDNLRSSGGGNDAFDHTTTLPVWLQQAGYRTGFVGKYLNEYGQHTPPVVEPGYDDWFAAIDPSTYQYWNYDVLDNGERRHFGNADEDYQTDVFTRRAVADIERFSKEGAPFFLAVWPLAPHSAEGEGVTVPLAPAPSRKYAGTRADVTLPRPVSFLESDVTDKPPAVQALLAKIAQDEVRNNVTKEQVVGLLEKLVQARAESLASVDDLVEQVVSALSASGQLDNTLIVFTSDNGWFVGEHGITVGKVLGYEESIRVPLLVRGPGFPRGKAVNQPVSNIDVPATILAITGATPTLPQEGVSLLAPATDPSKGADRALLLESTASVMKYRGIRTPGWSYMLHEDGVEELYDLFNDPYQVDNKATDPLFARTRARLRRAVDELGSCKGQACVASIPPGELR